MTVSAQGLILDLDNALAEVGEDVILKRLTGTQLISFDVKCRCNLQGYSPTQLIGDITQQDQSFIISPTEIDSQQWPGFKTGNTSATDDRIPKKNDVMITGRGKMSVQAAYGTYVDNVLVRIDGRVRGM